MASMVPPVEGAQGRPGPDVDQPLALKALGGEKLEGKLADLKCKLAKLQLLQVDDALFRCRVDLSGLKLMHVGNEQQRQDALVREQDRARRREAKAERMRMRHVQTTKIQALVRSYFVRRFVMPSVLEAKDAEELKKSRIALEDTMLGLHQNIHDLAFLEQDQRQAATHIQAWWRGVLAKRVVAIIGIRHHLHALRMVLAKAATQIASVVRGRQARMGCTRLRMEKQKRVQQAIKMQSDRMMKAVVKIQSNVRRKAAIETTKARRAHLAKELEGDGGGSPTNASQVETGRKTQQTDRSRRKRNNETHTGNKRGVSHHDSAPQAVDGELPPLDQHFGERRKSHMASHKAKLKPQQLLGSDLKSQKSLRKSQGDRLDRELSK